MSADLQDTKESPGPRLRTAVRRQAKLPVTEIQNLIEDLPDAIVIVDGEGHIVFVNAQTEKMLGYTRDELLGEPVETLIPERYRQRHVGHRAAFAAAPRNRAMGSDLRLTARRADGSELPVEICLNPLRADHGTFVIGSIRDVTGQRHAQQVIEAQKNELERANARLLELVRHDSLTGLNNRHALEEKLGEELQRSRRFRTPLSLLILDIDHFKEYNDTYGHLAGDEILTRLAQILQEQSRTIDFVARYGGEEFVILLANSDHHGAMMLAERYRTAIEQAFWERRPITVSIGAATFESPEGLDASIDGADLFAAADKALYHSKRGGRNLSTHANSLLITLLQ